MVWNSLLVSFLFVYTLLQSNIATAAGQYRLESKESNWQEAKKYCNLSTPDIQFEKEEILIKPNPTISSSLEDGDDAWIGYLKEFIYVELKGCMNEDDVQTNIKPTVTEPYQCANVCRHAALFGLTRTGENAGCICLNDTSKNLLQKRCNINCNKSDLLCGVEKNFAIYGDVSNGDKLSEVLYLNWEKRNANSLAKTRILEQYSWENCNVHYRPICSRTDTSPPIEPNGSEWNRAASNCLKENHSIQSRTKNLTVKIGADINERLWTANTRFTSVFRLNELHDQRASTIRQYGYVYKSGSKLYLRFANSAETRRKAICDEDGTRSTVSYTTGTAATTTKITSTITTTTAAPSKTTTGTEAATATTTTASTPVATVTTATLTLTPLSTTTAATALTPVTTKIPPSPRTTKKFSTAKNTTVSKPTTIPVIHADGDTSNDNSNSVTMKVLLILIVFVILPTVAVITWFIVKRKYVRKSNRVDNGEIPRRNEFGDTAEERQAEAEYEEIDIGDLAGNTDNPAVALTQANSKTATGDYHEYTYVTRGKGNVSADHFILEKNEPNNGDDTEIAAMSNITSGEGNASANYFILEKNELTSVDNTKVAIMSNNDVTSSPLHIYDKTGGANHNEPYDVIGKISKLSPDEHQNPYNTTKNVLSDNTYDTTQVRNWKDK